MKYEMIAKLFSFFVFKMFTTMQESKMIFKVEACPDFVEKILFNSVQRMDGWKNNLFS
jgi:hypothetical protein